MRAQARGRLAGVTATAAAVAAISLISIPHGLPDVARLEAPRFTVAMLRGEKQAAQSAPENAEAVAEAVVAAPKAPEKPVAAERETSLPEAVRAPAAPVVRPEPMPELPPPPVEVAPPAQVSMPGGRLAEADAPQGGASAEPFAAPPRKVHLRLTVDASGKVVSGAIVRPGPEAWRDAIILRAMRSRTYSTDNLQRLPSAEQRWTLDLTIDYGQDDHLAQ